MLGIRNVLAKGDQGDTVSHGRISRTRSRYGQNGFSFHRFSHLTANPWANAHRHRGKGTNSRKGKTKNSQIKISQLNGAQWWFSYIYIWIWKKRNSPSTAENPSLQHYSIWTTPFCVYGVNGRPPTQLCEATKWSDSCACEAFWIQWDNRTKKDRRSKPTHKQKKNQNSKHYEWPNLHKWS